jgi:hypothetical protein
MMPLESCIPSLPPLLLWSPSREKSISPFNCLPPSLHLCTSWSCHKCWQSCVKGGSFWTSVSGMHPQQTVSQN